MANKKYKVLYIDDEAPLRRLLNFLLKSEGYIPLEAENGNEGLVMVSTHRPDVIILDLALPDMDGGQVLTRIREWTQTPVIILTANKADEEKVLLLDMGADDYLVKPFHTPELLARIRVAIRHLEKNEQDPFINLGQLCLDLSGHIVKVKDQVIKLTSTEYDLLRILALNAGRVVTQKYLLENIWGPSNLENTHYLRIYVAQLRKKIEVPLEKKIIVTESGVGYRLKID